MEGNGHIVFRGTITWSRVPTMMLRFPQLFKIFFFLHSMESQGSLPRTCSEFHYSRPRPPSLVFMIHFNITFFSVRWFYEWAFFFILPNQNPVGIAVVVHT